MLQSFGKRKKLYLEIKLKMNIAQKAAESIKKAKTIIIFHHVAPDGDGLGSSLALKEMISQLDNVNKLDAVITGKIPDTYKFLPNIEYLEKSNASSLHQSYDLAIALDCACKDRLGDAEELFNNARNTLNIDHHISDDGFADIDWIEPKASATGEILFKLIEPLGIKLTQNIAIGLYTAILTDTGGFKFENTKPETFKICAELLAAGADPVNIYNECYESKPLAMVKLHARTIDNAIFLENNEIVYTKITRKLLEEINASDDHIDGITETLRQIDSVKIALVFKETTRGTTKVSFRSNGINVCEIASFFGGGGHKLASGCLLEKNIEDTVNDVITTVRKQVIKAKVHDFA